MSWRDLILNNFGWKLVSLLLATVVWYTFKSEGKKKLGEFELAGGFAVATSTRDFVQHPIRLLAPADDPRRFKLTPREVDITVAGRRSLLRELSAKEIQAFVNLNEPPADGSATNEVQVYLPSGVSLVRVAPAKVRIEAVSR